MTVKHPIQPGDGDPRHGTSTGYNHHGCKCEECRGWINNYHNIRNANGYRPPAISPGDGSPLHGTTTGYSRGCRCPDCKAGNALYMNDYRTKEKQK